MTSDQVAPAARRRSLAAIMTSVFAVGVTLGMAAPLVTLVMERQGHGSVAIGVVQAGYAASVLAAGPFLPAIIRRLGPVTTLAAGLVIGAAAFGLFPLAGGVTLWLLLRVLMGFGTVLDWVVTETWVNSVATPATRGRVVGLYAIFWSGGVAAGPIALTLIGSEGATPFLVGAGILLLGIVPVLAAAGTAPAMAEQASPASLATTIRMAPLAMLGVLICGVTETGMFALFPLYGVAAGLSVDQAVLLMSAFAAGSIALQPPLGWIAERVDRVRLLSAALLVSLVAILLVPAAVSWPVLAWPTLFVWGGAAAGLYTIGLILVGERFEAGDLASANTTLVMAYTLGMIIGPLLGGIGMELWSPHGLLAVFLAAHGLPLIVTLRRPRRAGAGAGG